MTTLERIKDLEWFDSISRLKIILNDLYNNSSGGGQDLQSVLESGATASINDTISFETNNSLNFTFSDYSEWNTGEGLYMYSDNYKNSLYINRQNLELSAKNSDDSKEARLYLAGGVGDIGGFSLFGKGKSDIFVTGVINSKNYHFILDPNNNECFFSDNTDVQKGIQYATDYSSNYTSRSLIDKGYLDNRIGNNRISFSSLPIYANNAAAITGGLTANDVYKTATGELRIVV